MRIESIEIRKGVNIRKQEEGQEINEEDQVILLAFSD